VGSEVSSDFQGLAVPLLLTTYTEKPSGSILILVLKLDDG